MSSGLRSPPLPRSSAASPRPKFDSDLLKVYMKKLLSSTLQASTWPETKDRDKIKSWMKEIGERVKERMLEIQPRGLYVSLFASLSLLHWLNLIISKYVVLTQINENRGQGGRCASVFFLSLMAIA